jgi:hypothetical protein
MRAGEMQSPSVNVACHRYLTIRIVKSAESALRPEYGAHSFRSVMTEPQARWNRICKYERKEFTFKWMTRNSGSRT